MTGSRDQAAKSEPVQHGAEAALRQHHAEAGLDRARQIGPAPADHAVLGQIRATADPLGDLALLLRRQ